MLIDKIYKLLKKEVLSYRLPAADAIHLQTNDPFKVLVATILSARTKDEVTVSAANRLFSKVKDIEDLKKLKLREIEKLIYPVGFYKTKAAYLHKLPTYLSGNKIPDNIGDLVKLPGVGRKTANLVLTISFKKHAICVDTHVHRIVNRIGYVSTETPYQTEMELRKKLPKKYWKNINSILVAFGQNICRPLSPFCSRCVIRKYCRRVGVEKHR